MIGSAEFLCKEDGVMYYGTKSMQKGRKESIR
jgi:hypothetical protein